MPRQKSPENVLNPHYHSPLAKSLRLLVERQAGGSVNAWVAKHPGLGQSTINRLCNGSSDASIDFLLKIAESTGYAPWQLVHPDFDPRSMPPVGNPRAMRIAAIFSGIEDKAMRDKAEAIMEQFAAPTTPRSAPAQPRAAAPAPTHGPARSRRKSSA